MNKSIAELLIGITASLEDFRTCDEQHMSKYYGDREHLLIRNISDANKSAPAG